MSSKIQISKHCEYCGKEFTARTTVTRFCTQKCAAKSYKQRKKENKFSKALEEANKAKHSFPKDSILESAKQKEFLSIKEAYTLLGISERTFYRVMKDGTIPTTKFGRRTIIKKSDIDKLFT
ncbi:helix-turn-helix domain-containing protein [Marinifilum sp. RC60d5]|uniref:helix-turn-helix domain-containing protein n=1 Tax=Marinifilum sp. RC60d5 TaxID=3458414 RepID=UPI0040372C38